MFAGVQIQQTQREDIHPVSPVRGRGKKHTGAHPERLPPHESISESHSRLFGRGQRKRKQPSTPVFSRLTSRSCAETPSGFPKLDPTLILSKLLSGVSLSVFVFELVAAPTASSAASCSSFLAPLTFGDFRLRVWRRVNYSSLYIR